MRKKIITIVILILVLGIGYVGYLQFGREINAVNCISMTASNYYQERLTVVLNKLVLTKSEEEAAKEIIRKVIANDFYKMKFSFDVQGYPNELRVSVYKTDIDLQNGKELFEFSYGHIDGEIGDYDITESEHMELKIIE